MYISNTRFVYLRIFEEDVFSATAWRWLINTSNEIIGFAVNKIIACIFHSKILFVIFLTEKIYKTLPLLPML